VFAHVHMPSPGGATEWLDSAPLGPAERRGHVVLVDFCTLTCINWLRTEPYIRAWSQAYRNDRLGVIGVHTSEFSSEHQIGRVGQATKGRGSTTRRGRQRLRNLERLPQPRLAGAVLRRHRRHHP
jgi:thiol-disulfide isomerase/thioredoxin